METTAHTIFNKPAKWTRREYGAERRAPRIICTYNHIVFGAVAKEDIMRRAPYAYTYHAGDVDAIKRAKEESRLKTELFSRVLEAEVYTYYGRNYPAIIAAYQEIQRISS
jgi:hypothetical protein